MSHIRLLPQYEGGSLLSELRPVELNVIYHGETTGICLSFSPKCDSCLSFGRPQNCRRLTSNDKTGPTFAANLQRRTKLVS